jgi:phosphoglycolate/pyridoxal phosphate phosphatase family enzyme
MLNQILEGIEIVLFDCDGVIYHGDAPLPGVRDILCDLRSRGVMYRFITNSANRSREEMHAKFVTMGLGDVVDEIDCFPSGMAAAEFLRTACTGLIKDVYVAGAKGLRCELERAGFRCHGGDSDNGKSMDDREFMRLIADDQIMDAVVVGYDTGFNYYKLARSCLAMQKNKKCVLVATNADPKDRIGDFSIPGNGAMLEAVCASIRSLPSDLRKDPTVTGKPNRLFGDLAIRGTGVAADKVLIIGDSIHTDIALGKNCGFRTCLVMAGVTSAHDLQVTPSHMHPDHVVRDLRDLLER